MGFLVNEEVLFDNGLTNVSGTYLTFTTIFPANQYKAIITIDAYLNQNSAYNNMSKMKISNLDHTLVIDFEMAEFLNLNLSTIYVKIIDHLSTIYNRENIIPVIE